eukprot:jgi/Chlat1/8238/Chrsp77S07687
MLGAAYPADKLETALKLIIENDCWDLLMLPIIYKALREKWRKFAQCAFWLRMTFAVTYMILFSFAAYHGNTLFGASKSRTPSRFGLVMEVIVVALAALYLVIDVRDVMYIQGPGVLVLCSWIHCILITVVAIPVNLTRYVDATSTIVAVAALFGWVHLLYFAAGWPMTGHLVAMLIDMLFNDVLRFLMLFSVIVVGFSQTFSKVNENMEKTQRSQWACFILLTQQKMSDGMQKKMSLGGGEKLDPKREAGARLSGQPVWSVHELISEEEMRRLQEEEAAKA